MTIETQQGKKSWIGDGSTTNYPYSYPFLNVSDIEVYLDGEKQASGFSVQNKTDYSTGANIIFDVAPAEGVLIVIRRNVPMTQEISYPENGEFPAKSHEKSLDKLTMLIIDNNKETLKVGPATPEDFDATFPVPEANKALKITADGKGFTMSDYDPDTALALTEDFKNQAQQAAIDALSSQTAAANSETVATQQANIATEKTAEVVESFNTANEWFTRLNAIPYIPVGTILPTTGAIDESLGYQRYANGQLIAGVSTVAPDLVKFLEFQETHAPNLLCSETEWQTALTLSTLGQVGKYVWNKEEDSVRIPRIVNIQGMMDINTVGNMVEAGLPNVTGGAANIYASIGNGDTFTDGAITITGKTGNRGTGNYSQADMTFDASSSNNIYGNSDTVQEESILYPYVLQIATGVQYKTPVINEIELNNPYVLLESKFFETPVYNLSWLISNGSFTGSKAKHPHSYDALLIELNADIEVGTTQNNYTKRGLPVKLVTDNYTDYDFVVNPADETFRPPLKVKLASGSAVVGNGMTLGLTNGTQNAGLTSSIINNTVHMTAAQNNYGVEISTTQPGNTTTIQGSLGITTDGTKSGIETSDSNLYLYFYVGETVQNANLIDAGRIEEKLSDKVDITNTKWAIEACMPDYQKQITLSTATTEQVYVAPCDGWFGYGFLTSGGVTGYVKVDDIEVVTNKSAGGNYYDYVSGIIPVNENDVIKYYTNEGTSTIAEYHKFVFYPMKGAN